MGTSTDGILFLGYCWEEEGVELLPDDADWQEVVLAKRGQVDPWKAYPKSIEKLPYPERDKESEAWVAAHGVEIDAWCAKMRSVEEEFGCDFGYHCSGECSIPYLHVIKSEIIARRGYPKRIDRLVVEHDWPEKLERFVREVGIESPEGQEPGWWLVSYWG